MSPDAGDPLPLPCPSGDLNRLRDDLDRHGYCLLEAVLGEGERRGVVDALKGPGNANRERPDPDDGAPLWAYRDGDEWVPLKIGEYALDYLVGHPIALALARHLLGERFHLSEFAAHVIHPGNRIMELHTDQWWMPQPKTPGEPAIRPGDITREVQPHGRPARSHRPISPSVVLSFMWAITDFTAANGATRLVPGSHLSGLHPDPACAYDEVTAEVPAGGAVVWDARTWHASGTNGSGAPRIGVQTSYCAVQFRQLRNFTLSLPPDVQATLSDEMRSLLGFRLWSSYGATDDYDVEFARPGYEGPSGRDVGAQGPQRRMTRE